MAPMNGEFIFCYSSEESNSSGNEVCDPLALEEVDGTAEFNGESCGKKWGAHKRKQLLQIPDYINVIKLNGGTITLYQCSTCQRKFKTKAHVKYHEFCKSGEKPYKCETCSQGFIARSHFQYHLRTHTGERPFVCKICGSGFKQNDKLNRHLRSHERGKLFWCPTPTCRRGFSTTRALKLHFRIHSFPCPFCKKLFICKTNLERHTLDHTARVGQTSGDSDRNCFGKPPTISVGLRQSRQSRPSTKRPRECTKGNQHSGMRAYKCLICDSTFTRKDNTIRHIQNIHDEPKESARQFCNVEVNIASFLNPAVTLNSDDTETLASPTSMISEIPKTRVKGCKI